MPDPVNPQAAAPATPAATPAAPAAVPATPAAPAAPAVVEPVAPVVAPAPGAVERPVATPNDDGTITYAQTGNPALDLSLGFFGKMGLPLDSPELLEAEKGNFQYLEAKLASMGDKAKGWEQYVALAKQAHTEITSYEKQQYEARAKLVHDTVGGEENWKAIQKWADENASPEEVREIQQAMQMGGKVAQAMALLLQQTFMTATGTTVNPANPTTNQPATPASASTPLTLAGYQAEVRALMARVGSVRMDGHPEYVALQRKYANVRR